jgi:triosephosphate isomerase (TIM)
MRKKLVAGNWKMHGGLSTNALLLQTLCLATRDPSFAGVEVAVFGPFPYLAQTESLLAGSSVQWGAQNLSEHPSGAFTGEVSVSMLRDFGCAYAIVGHSERRTLYGETDQQVAAKAATAIKGGLVPVICLGETLQERESGMTAAVVQRQLAAVIDVLGVGGLAKSVLAYEPVWAIGTGKTASPLQVQEVHSAIRAQMALFDQNCASAVRILYGGSVKPSNAAELFALADVDGGLVGGASLVAEEFLAICRAACV